ncbi:hypothetical protein NQZ68_024328 [Dissostichus eleginoides]|nr:hypothetical protein NQZ68_024328 [Dissostichus eleginoides]
MPGVCSGDDAETGPRTSAAVMENDQVEMAGLREGSWIVLGAWQRGAQSEYSGAAIPRIAEHDGLKAAWLELQQHERSL